jgi:hypothetical protein
MNPYLLLFCICYAISFPSAGQNIKLKKKGEVDVAFIYNDPFSYIDYPRDRTFKMTMDPQQDREINPGLMNVSSMALRVRIWTVLDDIVTNPVFAYKLNMEYLRGKKHTVWFQQISKYPDLVVRYKAIRPTSVNAVVGMGLNPDNEYEFGAYAFFNIRNNDLLIAASEKLPYAAAPASGSWGSIVQMAYSDEGHHYHFRHPSDFQSSNANKETMYKFLTKATHAAPYAWAKVQSGTVRKRNPPCNTYIRITWPEAAIDAIQELYLKYERGEEKPPGEEVAEALAKKNAERYNRDDEWAAAYEDDLKDVEAENDRNFIGLKSKSRVIATFEKEKYYNISPLRNTPFFELNGKEGKYIVDKRGNRQTIDGATRFDYITTDDKGQITAEIYLSDKTFIARESGLRFNESPGIYNAPQEVVKLVEDAIARRNRAREEEWNRLSEDEKKRRSGTVSIVMATSYHFRKIKRLVTTSHLQLLSKKEGYVLH